VSHRLRSTKYVTIRLQGASNRHASEILISLINIPPDDITGTASIGTLLCTYPHVFQLLRRRDGKGQTYEKRGELLVMARVPRPEKSPLLCCCIVTIPPHGAEGPGRSRVILRGHYKYSVHNYSLQMRNDAILAFKLLMRKFSTGNLCVIRE